MPEKPPGRVRDELDRAHSGPRRLQAQAGLSGWPCPVTVRKPAGHGWCHRHRLLLSAWRCPSITSSRKSKFGELTSRRLDERRKNGQA